MSEEMRPIAANAGRPADADYAPRLLAFYRDAYVGEDDYSAGYSRIAYGLRWRDGTCITMHEPLPGGPPAVTTWKSVDDALDGLDAYVCGFEPQRSAREGRQLPATATGSEPEAAEETDLGSGGDLDA